MKPLYKFVAYGFAYMEDGTNATANVENPPDNDYEFHSWQLDRDVVICWKLKSPSKEA